MLMWLIFWGVLLFGLVCAIAEILDDPYGVKKRAKR